VGLISYNANKAFEGYNLLYPLDQPTVFLLNNCGEIVHTWEDDANMVPGNSAYLLPNGDLVKTKRDRSSQGFITSSGRSEWVEVRDWDNNLMASFYANDSLQRLHHDIAITDRNTVLMIIWDLKSMDECIAAGKDTSQMQDDVILSEKIVEWDYKTDSIVWEWRVWDHLVQDFDSTKANYGRVALKHERIHVNRFTAQGDQDWLHFNSIDYDAERDLILISVPFFHEAWVIDHSTTTEEASSSNGGNSGHGGDLLYRWGNPYSYQAGSLNDKKLFLQHDVNWIDDFISKDDIHYKNIIAYNNRVGADFSTVNIWDPGYIESTNNFLLLDGLYQPDFFDRTIYHPDTTQLNSRTISGAQYLPNGNVLICAGRKGYSFEITPENEIVWEYITPMRNGFSVYQGDVLSGYPNSTFKIRRYPSNYPAFVGADLLPKGTIELGPNIGFCDELTETTNIDQKEKYVKSFPNPADDLLKIVMSGDEERVEIRNILTELVWSSTTADKYITINTTNWENGVYVLIVNRETIHKFVVSH